MNKIILAKEKETLLIPLYGKAKESRKRNPILADKKAIEIINQIDYDFSLLKIPDKTNTMMSLRARLIDDYVRDFLADNKDCGALHLGCGLDSRYYRIGDHEVDWYDIDFPEVIEIRQHFYTKSECYHLLGSSVTEPTWLEQIPGNKENYIVIAEGLLMYLREHEIKTLIRNLINSIGRFTLIFDAFNTFTAQRVNSHPSIKKTGADIHWGINDPAEMEQWGMDIRFLEQKFLTSNDVINQLNSGTRIMYKLANKFSFVKNAHRILIFEISRER